MLADAEPPSDARGNAEGSDAAKSEPRRPLEGVRVVDLSWVWAGPFAAMHLAHLGAEVIRCESSVRPDLYRRGGISNPPDGMEPSLNRAGMFNQWNQGKKSVSVDLSDPRAIEIVKGFVAESDVVVQNFGTGVMDRLGLGYEELKRINPRIILASISGYGQVGPYCEYLAYGPALVPLTGMSTVTGFIGGQPELFGPSIPDPTAGMTAAWAVVSALEQREQTGRGDHLDLSLWEATGVLAIEAWMQYAFNGTQPDRMGNRDPWMAPHGCFACRGEDEWVSIACTEDAQWVKLAALIDPALGGDERFLTLETRKQNEDALEQIVSEWTAGAGSVGSHLAAPGPGRGGVSELHDRGYRAGPASQCARIHRAARAPGGRSPNPRGHPVAARSAAQRRAHAGALPGGGYGHVADRGPRLRRGQDQGTARGRRAPLAPMFRRTERFASAELRGLASAEESSAQHWSPQ